MATATFPSFDLSRPKLRQASHWIRDELDPLVAREGPELLRADDILALHDIFQALEASSGVTALDLRATGIHKAIMEISGTATRWPGRLADDCDRLVDLWTAKFGCLDDLHPFLYGRGGRLEGIASVEETSKLALLKRWQDTCPNRISSKRARRRGDLGFHPGSWWINTMFACHAGIIDVDTIEGGICHDKYGAYAIVIIEGGEIEAPTESTLTYRCGKDDRGKFRLTAATPRSREPLRVLRSHSVNSMWGPKAGVRYEGLYRVSGWAVHQPKASVSKAGPIFRLGDMYYDVHLERCDPVPMDEVAKSPTAAELDDYSEFKRLRKVYRNVHNKSTADTQNTLPLPAKVVPTIAPPAPTTSGKASLLNASPAASRAATFTMVPASDSVWMPKNVFRDEPTIATEEGKVVTLKSPTSLSIPATASSLVQTKTSRRDMPRVHTPPGSERTGSIPSMLKSRPSIIEVAPWIDHDLPRLALSRTGDIALTTRPITRGQCVPDQPNSPCSARRKGMRDNNHDAYGAIPCPAPSRQAKNPEKELHKKEGRTSMLIRSCVPVDKLFDGAEDEVSTIIDYFSLRRPTSASDNSGHTLTAHGCCERSSSTGDTLQPVAPIPLKHRNPVSSLFERRDAVAFPCDYVMSQLSPLDHDQGFVAHDQSLEDHSSEDAPTGSLPISLKDLVTSPTAITASNTPMTSSSGKQTRINRRSSSCDASPGHAQALHRLKSIKGASEALDIKVAFRDPFSTLCHEQDRRRIPSSKVSPKAVV